MPLITLAVAAYVAGLLTGFANLALPALAVAILAAVAGLVRRDARTAGLAGILGAGVLMALASDAERSHCRARALAERSWSAVVEGAAAPGAYVPASVSLGGCTVRAALAVERGEAPAGARVRVTGTATPSTRGITIQRAHLVGREHGSWLIALRAAVGERIDTIFAGDAPLVRALLIADTQSLDPAVRDRFAAAGIVHMLSISGLHVAIIAAAVELLFVAVRLPRPAALAATLAATAGYIALIGAPPPALRSGVMLAVSALTRLAQRPTSPWAALALGAAAPLLAPRTALDIGWQLSVIGMASLIASGALTRRWIGPRLDGWHAKLAGIALSSLVASIVSAPLVTWSFGRMSLVAPLTNLAATPVIAVLQPTLFLTTLAAPIPSLARFLAGAAHPMLATLDLIATAGAGTPYGSITVAPTLHGALLGGVAAGGLVAACVSDFPGRPLAWALGALAFAVWLPLVPQHSDELELHLIDVGQGDAVALHTPRGRWVLVDAGRAWRGGDAGRTTIIPYLRRRGGPVALFVLTHPHDDHAGGAASVLRTLHPAAYWDGAYLGTSGAYYASLLTARRTAIRWHRVHPGETVDLDGIRIGVLAPDSAWMTTLDDPNEASVVLTVQYGMVRFLLMGDAERREEEWLLERAGPHLEADVLKVGHHGSSTSSTEPFLDAVHPRLALVSVGAGNRYGHPSGAVLRALARHGAVVLRTDQVGTVVVRTDGQTVRVEEGGDRWVLSSGSSHR
jgi:competence protein ComEC